MMPRTKSFVWLLAIALSMWAWLPAIAQSDGDVSLNDVAEKLQSLNISDAERAQVAGVLAKALGEGGLSPEQALSILMKLEEQLNQGLDVNNADVFVSEELEALGIAEGSTSNPSSDSEDEAPEEEDAGEDVEIEEDPDDDCEFDIEVGQYDEDCDDFDEDDQCEFNLETGRFDEDCLDFDQEEDEEESEDDEDVDEGEDEDPEEDEDEESEGEDD